MNKKLLLIKPPYQFFPVGFAYVLSCLETNGIPFDFIDTGLRPLKNLKRYLKKNDCLAVATGGLVGQFNFFSEVVHQVRTVNANLPIILGGNITKDAKSEFLFDKIGIDFGIIGEAETSLPYLIRLIVEGSDDFRSIPGLLYKDRFTGEIVRNVVQRFDLDKINVFPAWHFFDLDYYAAEQYMPFYGARSCMPVLTGRGCVGVCSFCSPTVGAFHPRQIKHIIEEIEFLNTNYDFEWIIFFNEIFYRTKDEILNFCRAYQNVKPKKPWVCGLRTDVDFDKETFMVMKETGCLGMGIGIESGSDKILGLMKKRTTAERTKRFCSLAKEIGISTAGTYMVGNEGETEEDLRQTIDMVISEEMNTGESLTCAYPGTLIYRNALKRGLIKDEWDYLWNLRFGAGVWETEWINRKYLNISEIPNDQFWNTIVKELRRYHTFLLHRFQVEDIECKNIFGIEYIRLSGSCSECGHRVVVYSQHRLLGIQDYCPNCFSNVYFNIYKLKDFASHFELLCKELKRANRLVILGTNSNACSMLRIDYFGLDYERLMGFLEDKKQVLSSTFIHMPRFRMEDMLDVLPDMILLADDPGGDAELLLKLFYSKRGILPPQIIHLIPDTKLWGIKFIRLVERVNVNKNTEIIYRLILVLVILLLKTRKIILDLLNPFFQLSRLGLRQFIKKLIRKIKYYL